MSLLEKAIGWLAPPVCIVCGLEGSTICQGCSAIEIIPFGERCFNCNALSPRCRTCSKCHHDGAPRFVWITTDYEATAKNLIQKFKFGHQRATADPIANLMVDNFLSFNSDADILKADYLVVPVPTASSRARERGFDHAALLSRLIAHRLKLQKISALKRIGQSRQVGVSRAQRIKQAQAQYLIVDPQAVHGRNILLIDDVVTTGATLKSVAKTLRKAGARRVDALVFAKRL
jgi:ComF family protein